MKLEPKDDTAALSDDQRRAVTAKIEEGFLQSERGEFMDGEQARAEIDAIKEQWRRSRGQ